MITGIIIGILCLGIFLLFLNIFSKRSYCSFNKEQISFLLEVLSRIESYSKMRKGKLIEDRTKLLKFLRSLNKEQKRFLEEVLILLERELK